MCVGECRGSVGVVSEWCRLTLVSDVSIVSKCQLTLVSTCRAGAQALARLTQPVHRPWLPSGRRRGSEVPVSRPRAWPSAAARLPAAAAGCSKSIDPLLRHKVEGIHRLGSLGYQAGPSEPHLTTSWTATERVRFGFVFGTVRPHRVVKWTVMCVKTKTNYCHQPWVRLPRIFVR